MTARNRIKRFFCAICLAAGLCASSQATTFSIKPVMLNPTCVAGTNIGFTCVQDADCYTNPGSGDGVCEGIPITFTCTGGATAGAPCSSSADCTAGVCGPDAMHEVAYLPTCYSVDPKAPVPNDGQPCIETSECESLLGLRDGVCAGNYEIELLPGDVVVTDILGADWSPHNVYPDEACRAWQIGVDPNSFINGECDPGGVFPWRWDRPLEVIPCTTDLDCPPQYPICDPIYMTCVGPNHYPEEGFFIDTTRPDYIFPDCIDIPAFDTRQLRAGSTCIQPGNEPLYVPLPKYLATMTLQVSDDACGLYTIQFDRDLTFMMNPYYQRLEPSVGELLIIDTGPVWPPPMTEPANCAIDACQTRDPDVVGAQGWDTVVFQFRPTDDLSGITRALFDLRRIPENPQFPLPPVIDSLDVDNVYKTVTLHLDKPIDPGTNGRWTCIEWAPRGMEFCWGYLPGDVTNDRAVVQNDIGALINHLVDPHAYPLELHQCDIDRSGSCTGADLLRWIDLFHGADPYAGWEGRGLISCPSNQPTKAVPGRSLRGTGD